MSKSKLTNSQRTILTSFLVLVSGTAEYRLRKIHNLGQSRHFAFGREYDKEATLVVVVMILSAYYVMNFEFLNFNNLNNSLITM